MKNGTLLLYFVAFIVAAGFAECTSVVGPRALRPHTAYRAAVAGGARAQTLYVAVEGRRATGETFEQGREVQVQPGTSRLVELEIDDPGPGSYSLVARSTAGPVFTAAAALTYHPRSYCVLVQTDKRVYRPGDTVSFRVVVLDKYLIPVTGAADVSVVDAGGAAVRQWARAPLDRGLLAAELPLDAEPALGEWTVQVEVQGQTYSRHILVADYVAPKFQMDIELPAQVLFSEGRFQVNVSAKHFNGRPVRGELTLSAYAVFFSNVLQPVFASPSRKVIDFGGRTELTYDLKTDLDLAEDAARPLVIEAVLEERDTLITQNVTGRILLLRAPYRLKVTAPEYFKPTLPYLVQVELVDPSGQLVPSSEEVTVERLWDDGAPANMTALTLDRGLAVYSLEPDASHAASTLNLVIKYKEVTERVINVRSGAASGRQHLTVALLSRDVTAGGELRVRITATEPVAALHYVVVARGDVVMAKTLELSPARRSVDAGLAVGAAWAPGVSVLAWYARADVDGRVVAAALYVPVGKLLQYEVSVEASGARSPGGALTLQVAGPAGAHAALLGADAAAAAAGLAGDRGLGSGLSLQTIEREAESFSGVRQSLFRNEDHHPALGLDLTGAALGDVFKNTGVVILTDGIVAEGNEGAPKTEEPSAESGTRPPLAGPYAFSRLPAPPAPRYYLPAAAAPPAPTWLMANFSLGQDGKGSLHRRTPLTPGDWTVGGFALHPTLGLGLAQPRTVATSTPLTLSADLPESMQVGEALAVVVTVRSSLTVDSDVEVTFHNSDLHFEFEPLDNDVDAAKKIELFRRLRVAVPARGAASTAFLVSVAKPGDAPVIVQASVQASGGGASADLFRTIKIRDGYSEEEWTWVLLDARRGAAQENVTLPVRRGTRRSAAALLAAGDLLAPALHAARMKPAPAGDPVSALTPMAVSAILLDYLKATNRDDGEGAVTSEARAAAAAGYQRLMAYRRADGSYSADAGADAEGDVWMTSAAARWLAAAARHVPVSPAAGAAAARWLQAAQEPDGGWPAPARAADPRAAARLPLAAHALRALLSLQSGELYRNTINKAIDFVARGVSGAADAGALAAAAAALAAARHPQARQALDMLDAHANGTGSIRWWGRRLGAGEWQNPWLFANSAGAVTAALGLRALLYAQLPEPAVGVARYLLAAQPAVMLQPEVLESLSELATTLRGNVRLRVSVNVSGLEEPRQFTLDDDNALIVQTQPLRSLGAAAARTAGRGVALAGARALGSTNVTAPWPRYTLDPRVDAVSTRDRLQLSVCVGFVPQGNETVAGLTLLTVQLPSGYLADINTITELMAARHVTRARLSGGGATVLAWLSAPGPRERCVTLAAPRALPVYRQRPGYATLQAVFDSSHRARVFFQPVAAHACDVCREWASCAGACGAAGAQRREPAGPAGAGAGGAGSASGAAGRPAAAAAAAALLVTAALLCR